MAQTLKLSYYPYTLKLKHTFTVSSFSRNETPVVLTEIKYNGKVGYGEASLPQYLGETQESVMDFLSKIDFRKFEDPLDNENILNYVDNIEDGNNAAKGRVQTGSGGGCEACSGWLWPQFPYTQGPGDAGYARGLNSIRSNSDRSRRGTRPPQPRAGRRFRAAQRPAVKLPRQGGRNGKALWLGDHSNDQRRHHGEQRD